MRIREQNIVAVLASNPTIAADIFEYVSTKHGINETQWTTLLLELTRARYIGSKLISRILDDPDTKRTTAFINDLSSAGLLARSTTGYGTTELLDLCTFMMAIDGEDFGFTYTIPELRQFKQSAGGDDDSGN